MIEVIKDTERIRATIPGVPPLTQEKIEEILAQMRAGDPRLMRMLSPDQVEQLEKDGYLLLSEETKPGDREIAIAEVTGPIIKPYLETDIERGLDRIYRAVGEMALSTRRNRNVNDNGRKA